MTDRNKRIRFMENNSAELLAASIDYSSALAAFPSTNATNKFRTKVWNVQGYFNITATNQELYINDGSDVTVSITIGEYTSPAALATQIQTDLNAASSNWTVSYSTTTYMFTISNSGSVTLRYSQTSSSIWDDIGYTGTIDVTSTSFVADEQRNHTEEHAIYDLGYQGEINFIGVIGPLDEEFSISSGATITLSGNNINSWSAPPFTTTLNRYDGGIFAFLDETSDTKFRYWNLKIVDKYNTGGPEAIRISHIYLGDYITSTARNIDRKFNKASVDPSKVSVSESGALYFDKKTNYMTFTNMKMIYLSRSDKDTITDMYNFLGTTTPFYISIDPTACITDNLDELTRYVVFSKEPVFSHLYDDKFSVSLEVKEVV